MNSVIVSFILSLWYGFIGILKESKLWDILDKVHGFFSNSFSNSFIIGLAKYESDGSLRKSSLFYRVFTLPVFVLSYLCEKVSGFVKSFVKKSVVSEPAFGYLTGFLALDVRFFGLMLLFSSGTLFALKLLTFNFAPLLILFALAGFGMCFLKVRLADYLDGSILVKFIKHSFGIDGVSFKIYSRNAKFMYLAAAVVGIVCGAGTMFTKLALLIPFAIFGVLAVIVYPVCGVFFAVFLAPIVPTMVLVGVCVLTIISSLAGKSYRGDYKIRIGRLGACLVFFLMLMFVSVIFSFGMTGSIGVFGMYLIFIGFYFTIKNEIKSKNMLKQLIKVFILSAAVVSVYGILQYMFGWTTKNAWIDTEMFEGSTLRVYSTLANPNVLGEYLILALPLCALAFVEFAENLWERIVYIAIFAFAVVCLVLTQSRGCWIGFFVSAVVFVTYYKSSLWKVLPLFILLLPFVLPETVINRFLSVGDMSDSSTSYRVYIWLGTLDMLKNFWICGIGPGEQAFRNVYHYYSYTGIIAPHSHNLYLQLIVESGICGLVVFISAIVIFFKNMINTQNKGRSWGIYATAFASAVAGFMVQSMFDYTFYNYRVLGIFFMVLAMGDVICRTARKEMAGIEKNN